MFYFLLLLLIKVSIKHVVASAHAQLFPLVITVGNTFPPLRTVRNRFPLVITVGSTFLLVITIRNTFPLVITVENTFSLFITVGKNNGSSFFLKKRGTSEMSSMGHHKMYMRNFFLEEEVNKVELLY